MRQQLRHEQNNDYARTNNTKVKDVIIAYLSDNSADLLLSVLACMNLTLAISVSEVSILPAMINGRWTPKEMERALRPSIIRNEETDDIHTTILLYGVGYEEAAREAVRLMNAANNQHFAVALSLPLKAEKYCTVRNVSYNPSCTTLEKDDLNQKWCIPSKLAVSNKDALLLFTSGTSSPNGAKGVRLSHQSLFVQAYAKTQSPCVYNDQTHMVATTVPWHHVGGMSSALAIILGGGTLVFPPTDTKYGTVKKVFQPEKILQSMQPSSTAKVVAANTLVVVPAMLHSIAEYTQNHHSHQPKVFPNVKLVLVGGQSIGNGKLYKQTRQLFPKARIVQTYACTEAGSSITFEDLGWNEDTRENDDDYCISANNTIANQAGATCVGLPPPHIQVGIFDEQQVANSTTNSQLSSGQMGIIGTRGSHIMSGYWKRGGSNYTKAANNTDNWMFTNDLGYIHPQSGKLYFCGRANDVIRTGGESVLATEVERILLSHNSIEECAVFALPDVKYGEAVCAAIVLTDTRVDTLYDGRAVAENEKMKKCIRKFCKEKHLAGFKQPRQVFCMQTLPRNSSGKVLKHAIIRSCASTEKTISRL